jgi:uncharacterized protein (TIGR02996 family)
MNTSPELLGLLRDAKANPDDIAPRLILADWLDDHGEPERAEFVRLQCGGTTPEQKRRAKQLAHAHELRWLGPVHSATHARAWKRGLLEASATPEQILHPSFAAEEQQAFEWIDRLRINNFAHGDLEALVAAPHLHTLNALTLELTRWDYKHREHGAISEDQSWASLGRLPTLPHLRELTLDGIPLDAQGLEALLAAGLDHLRALDIDRLATASLPDSRLAALPCLPGLRTLSVRAGWGESLPRWGDWPGLGSVERLVLRNAEPSWLVRLLASPFWRTLRHLDVSGRSFDRSELETLLALPSVADLRTLNLSSVEMDDVPVLIGCGALDRLERLELNSSYWCSDDAREALRGHFGDRYVYENRT